MIAVAPLRTVEVTRLGDSAPRVTDDQVVAEEPLEIRVAGDTLAVTMRTPGHDRELVLGFLWAEGILSSLGDVSAITHCGRLGDEGYGNTIEVTPSPAARLRLPDEDGRTTRRGTMTTSACGMCGRRTIDDLLARCTPVSPGGTMTKDALLCAVDGLRARQPLFARSGACHAASLGTFEGTHLATFEDVGRHNAVDKLVGASLLVGALPARERALFVSGRTSFEVVQKAVAAGIPVIVGVSAPSSLAIEVATRAGVTLVGFARGRECVVYAGHERISG